MEGPAYSYSMLLHACLPKRSPLGCSSARKTCYEHKSCGFWAVLDVPVHGSFVRIVGGTASRLRLGGLLPFEVLTEMVETVKHPAHQMNTQDELPQSDHYKQFSVWAEPFLKRKENTHA